MITQDFILGVTKPAFMLSYLAQGWFPGCNSDICKSIRSKKVNWQFNDKFEYRTYLANTNSGGSLTSSVFNENVGLTKPGNLEFGQYRATYGSIMDGFDIDMYINLETKDKVNAFAREYGTRFHSLRMNIASIWKNFTIHGQMGVVHQIRSIIDDESQAPIQLPASLNVNAGATSQGTIPAGNIQRGVPFAIRVPYNVTATGFADGKYLIKTVKSYSPDPDDATMTGKNGPRMAARADELYVILDNQPGYLVIMYVGAGTPTSWNDGEYLEIADNREIVGGVPIFRQFFGDTITVASGPYAGKSYKGLLSTAATSLASLYYTYGSKAVVGAMEGLPDLFPWYTDVGSDGYSDGVRLDVDIPYRDQQNRLQKTYQQCGGWITQYEGESIMHAVLRGVLQAKLNVGYADVGVWINTVTRQKIGQEEGSNMKWLRDNFSTGPILYQAGVKTVDYQIGTEVVREIMEDPNLDTDIIVIGPKDGISYNCWDNAAFEIDEYIKSTWGKNLPPDIKDLAIPDEFYSSMNIEKRILFGQVAMNDGPLATFTYGNGIRHPKNTIPMAMQECGAFFTEYPHLYTIVKLRAPIAQLPTDNG